MINEELAGSKARLRQTEEMSWTEEKVQKAGSGDEKAGQKVRCRRQAEEMRESWTED
jgi:hypothetical protein